MRTARSGQDGMILLEALIAIVIFTFGILGLISMQANAIALSSDAKFRSDAAILANQLVSRLSISSSAATNFAHRPTGGACAPGGADSTNPTVTAWLAEVNATLPSADSSKQQVTLDATNGVVVVTVCWQPVNGSQHSHTVTTQMQWQ